MKLQKLLSYVRRAVDDYNMIADGDKIAVGISGGKDSLTLLAALKALQRFYPNKFEIEAVSVSLGFDGMDFFEIKKFCDEIGVKYTIAQTDIGEIIFDARKEKNPCSLCAKMRKGALNDAAENLGCNKVALGHNRDDVIETFFYLCFMREEYIRLVPLLILTEKKIYSIRPLIYVPEKDVKSFVKAQKINIVENKCPVDGYTKREDIKEFVCSQISKYDHFEEKIFGAIKRAGVGGWKE